MKIGIMVFKSALHESERLKKKEEDVLSTLNKLSKELLFYKVKNETETDITIFLILTGGVENAVINVLKNYPYPRVLLADSKDNSLAAALEITAKLNILKKPVRIVMTDKKHELPELNNLIRILQTIKKLQNSRIGIIGKPSNWLVASTPEDETIEETLGLEIVHIPLQKIEEGFSKVKESDAKEIALRFIKEAKSIMETNEREVLKAAKLYLSIKYVIKSAATDAFTIRCFDLINSLGTTGCPALSLLNNEGIIAGCEGDIPALLSMYISYLLTASTPFMGNIADIDEDTIKITHCTIPTRIAKSYVIRTHFESQRGVGIQGELPKGEVTLLRIGGEKVNKYMIFNGTVKETDHHSEDLCRTQVNIKLNKRPDILFHHPLGNHMIVVQGNHTESLKTLFSSLGIKEVEN